MDRRLRELTLASIVLFSVSAAVFWIWNNVPSAIFVGAGIWGLAFGGSATLFQTASAKTSGPAADVAQSLLVTAWNTAIAAGGFLGGVLLDQFGTRALSPSALVLLIAAFIVALAAHKYGFTACRIGRKAS
ncbi:MFS transporter [Tistrella mobilis]